MDLKLYERDIIFDEATNDIKLQDQLESLQQQLAHYFQTRKGELINNEVFGFDSEIITNNIYSMNPETTQKIIETTLKDEIEKFIQQSQSLQLTTVLENNKLNIKIKTQTGDTLLLDKIIYIDFERS